MKIALLSPTFLPRVGGMEFVVHNLAQQWSAMGHQVIVLNCISSSPTEVGVRYAVRKFTLARGVTRFGYHRLPYRWLAARRVGKLLQEFSPDLVSAHMAYPTALWLAAIKPLPRFMVTCHGGDITLSDWGYRRRWSIDGILAESLNKAAAVVAISTDAHRLLEGLGVARQRIVDVPNGVDVGRFQKTVALDVRERLGLKSTARIILSVGREHPAKDYPSGIRAFARVLREVPEACYVIVGRNTAKWQGLIEDLGVSSRMVRCEELFGDDLVAAYQQSDVFFSPSVQETFPLVVLEAMAAGKPAVVTDVSGNQDAVVHEESGFIVPASDPEAMARALISVLTDDQLRGRLAEAGRSRAAGYTWERVSRMYLQSVEGSCIEHAMRSTR